MEFIKSQFSVTFDRKETIKRMANDIEDNFKAHFQNVQILPIPDEFAPDAPRVILASKHGHSQIALSQIAAVFNVQYDNNFFHDAQAVKDYIAERFEEVSNTLPRIGITSYLYSGVVHCLKLTEDNNPPVDTISKCVNPSVPAHEGDIYDASWMRAVKFNNSFFINEQLGVIKKYERHGNTVPELEHFNDNKLLEEAMMLTIDTNNRARYLESGTSYGVDDLISQFTDIYDIISGRIDAWGGIN
ncbi:hypothetical protein IJI55_02670 [Candidatus Saccharibacteria bacterium]|nr:hypothetical protein [Candidatus Saccharibacteria bacterium]